jgi:hypothetical protein
MGGPPPGMMGPPPGMMGPPPGMARPGTDQVRPLQAPPYLASQTAARMGAPVEPWAGSLKLIGIIFGALLVICFVVPWGVGGGKTVFSWTGFSHQPTEAKVMIFMIVGTGVLAILLATLPLATLGRGLGIAALGLAPILYAVFGTGKIPKWNVLVVLFGTLTLVSGLLIRAQYRGSIVGRLMATVGALAVIATLLIPTAASGDKVPLVTAFKGLGDAPGKYKLLSIVALLPFLLALLSLLVWLPASTSAGGTVIAWFWIPLGLVTGILTWVVTSRNPDQEIKMMLSSLFWIPIATMAWTAFVGYGIATAVGKQLEHA